jgi:hypothetical protein
MIYLQKHVSIHIAELHILHHGQCEKKKLMMYISDGVE